MDSVVSVQPALRSANQQRYRKYESPRQWRRTTRVYCEPGRCDAWFFQTREGVAVGPYDSQFEAEIEAGLLKELLKDLDDREASMAVIREFVLDSFAMGRPLSPRFDQIEATAAEG